MKTTIRFAGPTGRLASNLSKNWLTDLRQSNPAILDVFRDRDVLPCRDLLQWSGEFPGKYLTSSYHIYAITGDRSLKKAAAAFVDEVLGYQAENGYLGCFDTEMSGAFPSNPETPNQNWDAWGHYHLMCGLLLWEKELRNPRIAPALKKMADFFLTHFYSGKRPLSSLNWSEMNLAVYHGFALLYERFHDERYLAFAKEIENDMRGEGDYLSIGLAKIDFYACPKPRWESMHVLMGFTEMYKITKEARYLDASVFLADSILRTDVHNTGGFSTREQAVGNPFTFGPIETCCVVAFDAFVNGLWQITHDIRYIDHLETAHYNAILGSCSPTGVWSTYDTPMEGERRANFHEIGFQDKPGAPMLNCCSVNAPRGVGEIGTWAVREAEDILYINTFEALTYQSDTASVSIKSAFPYEGKIALRVDTEKTVLLRIPAWASAPVLTVNGAPVAANPGRYLTVPGHADITAVFPMPCLFVEGEADVQGRVSVQYGPLLFAWDASYNPQDRGVIPTLKIADLKKAVPESIDGGACVRLPDGHLLVNFALAGQRGSHYTTWMYVK